MTNFNPLIFSALFFASLNAGAQTATPQVVDLIPPKVKILKATRYQYKRRASLEVWIVARDNVQVARIKVWFDLDGNRQPGDREIFWARQVGPDRWIAHVPLPLKRPKKKQILKVFAEDTSGNVSVDQKLVDLRHK